MSPLSTRHRKANTRKMIPPMSSFVCAPLLLAQTGPAGGPAGSFSFLIPLGLMLIIFYFMLIRPASKKQKALQGLIEGLKNGDKVITTGGIHGVVAGITDDIIQLKIASNVKIEISRNAIAGLQKEKGD